MLTSKAGVGGQHLPRMPLGEAARQPSADMRVLSDRGVYPGGDAAGERSGRGPRPPDGALNRSATRPGSPRASRAPGSRSHARRGPRPPAGSGAAFELLPHRVGHSNLRQFQDASRPSARRPPPGSTFVRPAVLFRGAGNQPNSRSRSRLASSSVSSGTALTRVFSNASPPERNGPSRIACTSRSSESPWAARHLADLLHRGLGIVMLGDHANARRATRPLARPAARLPGPRPEHAPAASRGCRRRCGPPVRRARPAAAAASAAQPAAGTAVPSCRTPRPGLGEHHAGYAMRRGHRAKRLERVEDMLHVILHPPVQAHD